MTNFYLNLTGPYDSVYVGPFADRNAAKSKGATYSLNSEFDAFCLCVVTGAEKIANESEFGPLPTYSPNTYDFG